ncbi:MAG: 4-(cytidine 5'-diphospho)-2-C-methyl-D-erythritol kinase [Proteobacteria bacterium]|nr:4-(cytidine 5'-diphospho)-2-C-methyl-D-erythritol kinase [Burkholderiales bacterium]
MLHVVGRREDGYHLLQTVFRFIDHADSIGLAVRQDRKIVRINDLPGVPMAADLAVRAALALQTATGCSLGADIEVIKRIPQGGGLGGGSSDAATVLLALNHLWRTGLSRQRLQTLGLTLGADVPAFVFGETAFAGGVGEELTPVAAEPAWYLVLVPPISVPTREVFAATDLTRDSPAAKIGGFAEPHFRFPLAPGRNDLEPVVVARFAEVHEHLSWLRQHAVSAMSGSGACVFAAFANEADARAVFALRPASMQGFVAVGLDRHPLHAFADS